jgi:uncharacterized protein YukE
MNKMYKWDVEELKHCASRLEKQKENLVQYEQEISTLKDDISQAWQSIAGTAYENSIYIDQTLISQIIVSLEQEISKLNNVISKDYQPCEETLKTGANNLATQIKAL